MLFILKVIDNKKFIERRKVHKKVINYKRNRTKKKQL